MAYYIYDNEYSVYIANECLGKQVFETLSHGFTFRVLKRKGQQVWSPLSQAYRSHALDSSKDGGPWTLSHSCVPAGTRALCSYCVTLPLKMLLFYRNICSPFLWPLESTRYYNSFRLSLLSRLSAQQHWDDFMSICKSKCSVHCSSFHFCPVISWEDVRLFIELLTGEEIRQKKLWS